MRLLRVVVDRTHKRDKNSRLGSKRSTPEPYGTQKGKNRHWGGRDLSHAKSRKRKLKQGAPRGGVGIFDFPNQVVNGAESMPGAGDGPRRRFSRSGRKPTRDWKPLAQK